MGGRQRNWSPACAREIRGRDVQVEDGTSLVAFCDEELKLHCGRFELCIQAALEPQRGKAICLLCFAGVVALRLVCRARAGELGTSLCSLYLNAFVRL